MQLSKRYLREGGAITAKGGFRAAIGVLGIGILLTVLVPGVLMVLSFTLGWDKSSGSRENAASVAQASDCPFDLPPGAVDISYAYDMQFQGGAKICRFRLPEGDLQKAAWASFGTNDPFPEWKAITPYSLATYVAHRFNASWFDPYEITEGWETKTSGILWQPKVWVDVPSRTIFLLHQN